MLLEIGVAFAAGALALLSPCTAPILPGLSAALWAGGGKSGGRLVQIVRLLAFAVGAATILVGSVALALVASAPINFADPPFSIVAGLVLILTAFVNLGYVRVSLPQRVSRLGSVTSSIGALVLGAACAAVWYPCLGPSLALTYGLASRVESVPLAVLFAFTYFSGLLVPLILLGFVFVRMSRARRGLRRFGVFANRFLSFALIGMGLLLLTGTWEFVSLFIVDKLGQGLVL